MGGSTREGGWVDTPFHRDFGKLVLGCTEADLFLTRDGWKGESEKNKDVWPEKGVPFLNIFSLLKYEIS